MAQAQRIKTDQPAIRVGIFRFLNGILREISFWPLAVMALGMIGALVSFHPADPAWTQTAEVAQLHNWGGAAGAWFADVSLYFFGYPAYLLPLGVAFAGWRLFKRGALLELDGEIVLFRVLGFAVALASASALATLHLRGLPGTLPGDSTAGGLVGVYVGQFLVQAFGFTGGNGFMVGLLLAGLTLMTGVPWLTMVDWIGAILLKVLDGAGWLVMAPLNWITRTSARDKRDEPEGDETESVSEPPRVESVPADDAKDHPSAVSTTTAEWRARLTEMVVAKPLAWWQAYRAAVAVDKEPALSAMQPDVLVKRPVESREVKAPPMTLAPTVAEAVTEETIVPAPPPPKKSKPSSVVNPPSPVAPSQQPPPSTAWALPPLDLLDVSPRPNGSEPSNRQQQRERVSLREVLASAIYQQSPSPLTLALGNDLGGHPVIASLAKMPHLLVAGTAGSGKSVAVNTMLLSLLYKASPDEVRLILVDLQKLELSMYADIPHLLTPVVTRRQDLADAWRWCIAEMERRYRLMAALKVRNINGFNRKVQEALAADAGLPNPLWSTDRTKIGKESKILQSLPWIVVVVDELADLMTSMAHAEEEIAQLAQKAHAAGIHLLLATQQPSEAVLTGLIKAHIPARIAFRVASEADSRTLIGQSGAEQLGHGDMLYLPAATDTPQRVQGASVSDHEIQRVVKHLRQVAG